AKVRFRQGEFLSALIGEAERRDDGVTLAREEGRHEAVEFAMLEKAGALDACANSVHEVDLEADHLAFLAEIGVRRMGGLRQQHERLLLLRRLGGIAEGMSRRGKASERNGGGETGEVPRRGAEKASRAARRRARASPLKKCRTVGFGRQ